MTARELAASMARHPAGKALPVDGRACSPLLALVVDQAAGEVGAGLRRVAGEGGRAEGSRTALRAAADGAR